MMSKKNQLKYGVTAFILIVIIGSIGYYLARKRDNNTPPAKENTIPTVTTTPLSYYRAPKTVSAYGSTISPKTVTLKAQTAAYIKNIYFKPGNTVKAGQLLFTLKQNNPPETLARLKEKMNLSKNYYSRLHTISNEVYGSIARFDLEKAKSQYQQDADAYHSAYQQEQRTDTIHAPISGIISTTPVTHGSFIQVGDTLATLVAPHSIVVKYELPSQYDNKVHLGDRIVFSPENLNKQCLGSVTYIAPLLDATSYDVILHGTLKQCPHLKLHTFGTVLHVTDPDHYILAIPQTLVQTDTVGFYATTVTNGYVKKSHFVPGTITNSGLIEVKSGIMPGTPIVTSDPTLFTSGQKVQVKNP